MLAKHLYEYAVIRVMPRVEREEFMNVGVIVFSKQSRFLDCRYQLSESRLLPFIYDNVRFADLLASLESLQRICHASAGSGPIGCLDTASRFRWLTATRSTVIQTSKVHSGFCDDLNTVVDRLFADLVLM